MDEEHPRDALTPYAASKSAADQVIDSYIKTFGIDATTVRPFNNFGPRQNPGTYAGIIPIIVNNVRDGVPVQIHGDGEQTRDFLFVRKTADMIVQVFQSAACRGTDVNVATGVETSVNDLVRRMLQVLGVPDHPVVHTDPRPGDVRRHCADVAKARKLLGTSPEPMSDDELAETIDWYRSALR
jgi:UDP-glucose 4-epimerase